MFSSFYDKYLLKYPKLFISIIVLIMLIMFSFSFKLEVDASAETLLLEGDKDLQFTREISKKFKTPDVLILSYSSKDDLLNNKNIQNIQDISTKILSLQEIESITSILNVPLLESPIKPIKELLNGVTTLLSKDVDKDLAKKEFLTSPIYKKNLVSDDFKTTALLLNIKRDEKYFELINLRDSFLILKKNEELNKKELVEFEKVKQELKSYRDIQRIQTHALIVDIRNITKQFKNTHDVKLYLGGATMVADDMVEFVKSDLSIFGYVIVGLLIIILYILFAEIRWVIIPLFICTTSIIITSGFLGLLNWEITVISSNFISLQLIMNMSLVVHLIIKYKELLLLYPDSTQKELLQKTVVSMWKPSFFVVLTTIAGFSSLVFSGILPIITFGWMMSIGIIVSLLLTFILFPLLLGFLNKGNVKKIKKENHSFTLYLAKISFTYKKSILFCTFIVVMFSITGAMKLRVENSFIDYFKESTEIYKGMKLIDEKLGGTTPLDVILTFKENSDEIDSISFNSQTAKDIESEDELDSFDDEFELSLEDKKQYWFTKSKMDKIKLVHNYLDSLEAIGKVQSLATLLEVGKILNDGKELDSLTLALMNNELPNKYKEIILNPYVNIENNMARISTRVVDSLKNLNRDELLKKIDNDLKNMLNNTTVEYKVSNLLVIYNNMLQSLFDSQIKTIGLVVLILFIMFLVVFKNIKIAIVAIIVNTIPVGVIFGFMGWMNISLDLMTITIAAISIGIAIVDTIHYMHRFQLEYKNTHDVTLSIENSHKSIGRAMFYTSTIIMVGFSILVLSNFIPSIYFGVLTVLAMFMAIVSDLLLLPILLILIRPK